jgi:hypothetical protein
VAISDGIGGQWGKDEMCVMHWRKALLCFWCLFLPHFFKKEAVKEQQRKERGQGKPAGSKVRVSRRWERYLLKYSTLQYSTRVDWGWLAGVGGAE